MENLAGRADCDAQIRRELERARIPIEQVDRVNTEVPYSLVGRLGAIEFRRAWYYWVANGPVKLQVAEMIYEDPVGRTDIRVAGSAGCPPPHEWAEDYRGVQCVMTHHIDTEVGLRIFVDYLKSNPWWQ